MLHVLGKKIVNRECRCCEGGEELDEVAVVDVVVAVAEDVGMDVVCNVGVVTCRMSWMFTTTLSESSNDVAAICAISLVELEVICCGRGV
mgnify:CR=1 FL=1